MQGYQTFWLDRNRHGGGIIMYILERYAVIAHDNVYRTFHCYGKACISLIFSSRQHTSVCFCGSLCPHLSHIVTVSHVRYCHYLVNFTAASNTTLATMCVCVLPDEDRQGVTETSRIKFSCLLAKVRKLQPYSEKSNTVTS